MTLQPAERAAIQAGFVGVVQSPGGTAYGIFTGPLASHDLAGKTGTAQVAGKQSTSIFTSFAPASNPQYEVTAILEQAGYGADVAGPVVRQIYDALYGLPAQPIGVVAESGSRAGPDVSERNAWVAGEASDHPCPGGPRVMAHR